MSRFNQSIQLIKEAYSLGWRNKNLFWYGALLALTVILGASLILGAFSIIGLGDIPSIFQGIMILLFLIFSMFFIINVFLTTLLNRIYALMNHKDVSFKKSVSFKEGILWSIAFLSVISAFMHILQTSRVNDLIVSYVGEGSLVLGLLYVVFWSFSLLWSIATFYFLAILVKENKGFVQTLKDSWRFVWDNLLITGVAWIASVVWNFFLLFIIIAAGAGITYIIGLIFSIGFSLNWWLICGAVVVAPILYLMCYIFVVWAILPAIIYTRLNKSR